MRDAVDTANAIRQGELSATEALDEARRSVVASNDALIAFVYIDWEGTNRIAAEIDARIRKGDDPGPLAGVPFGVKDLDDCAGMPTSHGSLIFKGSPPKTEDSPHVARLRAAGAVPIGKTAPSEFGMDSATTTRAWGVTRNPWRSDRTPGGSSGGSAAAVSAGMVPFATSSDLGGSTRTPASFTGLVGLKPSEGRIPQRPSTTDLGMHGVLTRTVRDTARCLDVMAGPWRGDVRSLPPPPLNYENVIEDLELKGLRVAWSSDLGFAAVEREVEQISRATAMRLSEAANLEMTSDKPVFSEPGPIIFNIEFPRWIHDLTKQGIWPQSKELLSRAGVWAAEFGLSVDFEAFLEAELDLVTVRRQIGDFFTNHDVLMTPTVACRAYGADDPYPTEVEGRDVRHTTIEPFTQLSTLAWLPAVSVPAGMSSDGLPIGLQIVGAPHRDDVVLRLARILELVQPWPLMPPLRTAPGV